MRCKAEIDEIDAKILALLIKDPRTKLKDVAESCRLSSFSVLMRIKRMKTCRIIVGTTVFPDITKLGFNQVTFVGIKLDYSHQAEIIKLLEEHASVTELSPSVGKYDLCAVIITKDTSELNEIIHTIKSYAGIEKISLNTWVGQPQFSLENLDLQPRRLKSNEENRNPNTQ